MARAAIPYSSTTTGSNATVNNDYFSTLDNLTQQEGMTVYPEGITFQDIKTGKQIGRLTWEDGELKFEGNVGSSAKKFLDAMSRHMDIKKLQS